MITASVLLLTIALVMTASFLGVSSDSLLLDRGGRALASITDRQTEEHTPPGEHTRETNTFVSYRFTVAQRSFGATRVQIGSACGELAPGSTTAVAYEVRNPGHNVLVCNRTLDSPFLFLIPFTLGVFALLILWAGLTYTRAPRIVRMGVEAIATRERGANQFIVGGRTYKATDPVGRKDPAHLFADGTSLVLYDPERPSQNIVITENLWHALQSPL